MFTDRLREGADPIWQKILVHPFVRELSDGSLPKDKFRFFIEQDYHYIVEYSRCVAIAAAKAQDLETMKALSDFLHSTHTIEMDSLVRLAEGIGIPEEDLLRVEPTPTNYAYTRHLLAVAYSGQVGELLAAILACEWSYLEVGEALTSSEGIKTQRVYAEWSELYASSEYRTLVSLLRGLTDKIAEGSSDLEKEAMRRQFMLGSKYEYMFWDMAYRKERWPV